MLSFSPPLRARDTQQRNQSNMSKAFLLLVLLAALLGLVSCRLASHPADSSSVLMRVNDVLMKELNVLDGETHDVQHQQRFSGVRTVMCA